MLAVNSCSNTMFSGKNLPLKRDIIKNTLKPTEDTGRVFDKPSEPPAVRYGKHKIKRYLYHFTSINNLKKIIRSGKIEVSDDYSLDYSGVFMTELPNLLKHWRTSKDWDEVIGNPYGTYLSIALFGSALKGDKKMVCLRVPTKALDHDLLKIRSQNKLGLQTTNPNQEIMHVHTGVPAKDSSLYKKRKEAIEYIYKKNIPFHKVDVVGVADLSDFSDSEYILTMTRDKQKKKVLDILNELFKGHPEERAVKEFARSKTL